MSQSPLSTTTTTQPGVHPSAIGSATKPETSSTDPSKNGDVSSADGGAGPTATDDYPEQRHAGKVGYGPNLNRGADFPEKLKGIKEQVKGKLTHDPELVQLGKDRKTGELKRREMFEKDDDPFATPGEKEGESKGDKKDEVKDETKPATNLASKNGDTERVETATPAVNPAENGHQ